MKFEDNFLNPDKQPPLNPANIPGADAIKDQIEKMDQSSKNLTRLAKIMEVVLDGVSSMEEMDEIRQEMLDYIGRGKKHPRAKAFEELGEASVEKRELTESLDDDAEEEPLEIYDENGIERPESEGVSDEEVLKALEYFQEREKRKKFEFDNPLPEAEDEETEEEKKREEEADEIYRLELEDQGVVDPIDAPGRVDEIRAEKHIRKVHDVLRKLEKDPRTVGLNEDDLTMEAERIVQEEDEELEKVRKEIKSLVI